MREPAREREVDDVETLKALADPLRLAILGVLTRHGRDARSVKQVAAELGESPSKLYRHVRQLEKVGLIAVAGTRLVSGIVESRYVAAQRSLRLSRAILQGTPGEQPEALDTLLAALDATRAELRDHFLAGRIDLGAPRDGSAGLPTALGHFTLRVSPERYLRLTGQLWALLDELAGEGDCPDEHAVDITLFSLLYAAVPPRLPDDPPTAPPQLPDDRSAAPPGPAGP
ncbi:helix-turn-helix domain-containing protein [Kitasatospora sp. NPDC002227]|uniref:ArsR/SmtB family transcription factor n=1 Tax=Kitasatospora sp. NPDC002227 TaxID=3154773 RepID=UPI00331AD691